MNSDLVSVLSTVEDPRSDKNKRYLLETFARKDPY